MKTILTNSFVRLSSDYKRQPGSLPGENNNGQSSILNDKDEDKLKRKNKVPSKKIYQFGVDVPVAEKVEVGTL